MKDVGGVAETRSWLTKFKTAWAITTSKMVTLKILKPYAHLHIIGRKSTKFQVNLMKDVGGVAETRSLGRMARQTEGRTEGWMEGQTERIMHTRTDEGHFYSRPPPTSGDNFDQLYVR